MSETTSRSKNYIWGLTIFMGLIGLLDQYTSLVEGPLFWTPDSITEYAYAISTTRTRTRSIGFEFSLDSYFSWESSVDVPFVGTVFSAEGKVGVTYDFSSTITSTSATQQNREIICHLEDDDGAPIGEHDQFATYIYRDRHFNTFGVIFDEDFTYTSRPFEINTKDRRSPTTSELFNLEEYQQGTIELNCIAVDEETGVNHTKFYYDDDPVFDEVTSILIGSQTNASILDSTLYQISWNTTTLHGTYYLFVVVYDNANPLKNTQVSIAYTIQVDNVLPIICEVRAYGPFTGAVNLYTNTFDSDSGIILVEYWDGVPDGPQSTLLGIGYDPSSSFNYIWPTDPSGSDDGIHYVYARAYDRAGNYLTSSAIEIQVDCQASLAGDMTPIWISIIIGSVAVAGAILGHGIIRNRHTARESPMKKGIFKDKPPKGA